MLIEQMSGRLIVYFDDPFWVGIFERVEKGIGTKSQQAIKLLQEQNKLERKVKSREQKEAEELRLFELKQQKKKEKHKGH